MKKCSRKIIVLILTVAAVGVAPAFFPRSVEARTAVPVIITPDGAKVGGEPGEDPHLKIIPKLSFTIKDSDPARCTGSGEAGDMGVCGTQAEDMREGRGISFGSRMNLAWRMILRTWLWQLQR